MVAQHNLLNQLQTGEVVIPSIKGGQIISGVVIRRWDYWVLVDCWDWAFTWMILAKEVKDLERNGYDLAIGQPLEAEILWWDIMSDEWYYVISISKLKQKDILDDLLAKKDADEILTVIPTEANLWWLLVDMHGIKWFIPLSQLAPIHYPRVEDGDQEKIFEALLELLWKEFVVRIINFDEDGKRMILSEREALREERQKIMETIAVWNEYDGVISGISSYWFFVTIGWGIEWLVHISEITYGHVSNIDHLGWLWEPMKVKVIWLDDGKISLSSKKLKPDPWTIIPQNYTVGDIIEGEVVRYVPYWVFIRVYDDINGLVHLSEITEAWVDNPSQALKIWQVIQAKIILLEPQNRKIWLSIKAMREDTEEENKEENKKNKEENKATAS